MVMTPPRPRYVGQPANNTPPSTMPIYNVLPPIISPSDQMHMEDSDCEILAPLAEAFRPPLSTTTKKSTKNKNSNNKDTKVIKNGDNSSLGNPPVRTHLPIEEKYASAAAPPVSPSSSSSSSSSPNPFFILNSQQLDLLIECMRRSHSSRREILRSRRLFLHRPSLNEIERLDESQPPNDECGCF
jgi:hypothetical protein